ncbi:MAG: hypothetical protein M3527_07400 [Actinomycetota bacterium]|nr:hypothetical protein [Acidimicrobiia bacterium]MDQ3294258.1 hypothetical protein [Actinomycetota bacterium]
MTGAPDPFHCELRVRFGECDMQGVVFNAHYLAYVDDAIDRWFAAVAPGNEDFMNVMVKKATIEWSSGVRHADVLDLAPRVERWGNTSFDVVVDGRVGDRPVFTATLVYVAVDLATNTAVRVSDGLRTALS